MKLENITLSNYRSIHSVQLPIKRVKRSNTYCLFGVNESGKSSFLKGLSLYDEKDLKYPEDYFDDSEPVSLIFEYKTNESNVKVLREKLKSKFDFPKNLLSHISFSKVEIEISHSATAEKERSITETISFKKSKFPNYRLSTEEKIEKTENKDDVLDLNEFMSEHLPKHFWTYSHNLMLWKATDEFLIKDEIDLDEFMEKPYDVSIPLANSFILAGIPSDKIKDKLSKLKGPTSIRNLESLLSEKVTEHITNVWNNHPIDIKFEINERKITLLVEDVGVKYKAKTTSQRSDGFRQFISFLLSISAENSNDELSDTIMLLDEPETHLHPQAQVDLMNELIKMSMTNDNMVFYATHSNYMIDKRNLERNIKVVKMSNEKTELEYLSQKNSTYSEVNYTVFNIPTSDYHNELYGYLEDVEPKKLNSIEKDRKWINELSGKTETVSLPKYIRNSIHHPENDSNKAFSERQLRKSIEILRKLKYN